MLLVDSSVWIDRTRAVETLATRFVDAREGAEELALTAGIYLEVLQGVRDDAVFGRLKAMLEALAFLHPRDGLQTYELAAQLYRRARRAGFTIRKSSDCLIAAIALEHQALLIHNDRDFLALAKIEPRLHIYPGSPAQAH